MVSYLNYIGIDCFRVILQYSDICGILRCSYSNRNFHKLIHSPMTYKYCTIIVNPENQVNVMNSSISKYFCKLSLTDFEPCHTQIQFERYEHNNLHKILMNNCRRLSKDCFDSLLKLNHLMAIHIINCQFENEIAVKSLEQFAQIETLELSGCYMLFIHNFHGFDNYMQYHDNYNFDGFDYEPENAINLCFRNMKSLIDLRIHGNDLSLMLDFKYVSENLKKIEFANGRNKIINLSRCDKLCNLSLKGFKLDADLDELLSNFNFNQLTYLKLTQCRIGQSTLMQMAQNINCLQVLSLSTNQILGECVPLWISVIAKSPDLKFLDLSKNSIKLYGVYSLINQLKYLKHDVKIDLRSNLINTNLEKMMLITRLSQYPNLICKI